MLVLSRTAGQAVLLGSDVRVVVAGVNEAAVELRVEAQWSIRIEDRSGKRISSVGTIALTKKDRITLFESMPGDESTDLSNESVAVAGLLGNRWDSFRSWMPGESVQITIVEIRAGKTRLGIEGPMSMSVHREERR